MFTLQSEVDPFAGAALDWCSHLSEVPSKLWPLMSGDMVSVYPALYKCQLWTVLF